MFLALRELQHSRLRYLLLGAIITMIAWLTFLLSGLANGLSTDNASTIQKMPADYFVFQSGARLVIGRSLLPLAEVDQIRQVPGVTAAAPLGQMLLAVKREAGGEQLDATMLGIEAGSFIAPKSWRAKASTQRTTMASLWIRSWPIKECSSGIP